MSPPLIRRVPRRVWGVAILAVAAVLVLADARDRAEWALFVGRFHPLVVHLPIGGLLVAAMLAAASRTVRGARARAAVFPVLLISAGGAVAAVVAGHLLSASAPAGSVFLWHRALGYVVALVTILGAVSTYVDTSVDSPRPSRRSDSLIAVAVLLLLVTGHLGGTMTRGAGYLTEHLPRRLRLLVPGGTEARSTALVDPQQVVVYTALVAPILERHCESCHGPDKTSGGLRLDSPDRIREGGTSGRVVTAGQAAASELVRRIWLPVTHADAMPPKGRAPVTVAEANLLRWWVDRGASFDLTLADLEIDDEVRPAIEARVGPLLTGSAAILSLEVPPVDVTALEGLVRHGLPVNRLAEGASLLQVQARGMGRVFGDAEVQALVPVARQVTWLDLGGTAVTDASLAVLARFPHLSRLHLDRTAVTDEGLQALRGLEHLEYLNLYGTAVSDAGLAALAELPRLRAAYLWQSAVTDAGMATLRAARPALRIEAGLPAR